MAAERVDQVAYPTLHLNHPSHQQPYVPPHLVRRRRHVALGEVAHNDAPRRERIAQQPAVALEVDHLRQREGGRGRTHRAGGMADQVKSGRNPPHYRHLCTHQRHRAMYACKSQQLLNTLLECSCLHVVSIYRGKKRRDNITP